MAASAGGKFGPDGNGSGDASQGFWRGYTRVRVFPDHKHLPVVEQRPVFDWIGHRLLLAESLRGLWTSLYNMPVVPLTNFNNTVVLGSLVFALLLSVPLFFVLRWAVARYRVTIGERVRQSRFYKTVMASKVYNVYKMFRP